MANAGLSVQSSPSKPVRLEHIDIKHVIEKHYVRGVPLDYASWASKNAVPLAPLSSTGIPFSHLQCVIDDQNVAFRSGDFFFIRSGFTATYNALSPPEKVALSKRPSDDFAGVELTEDILQWLWESQLAAVAGDAPGFELLTVGGGKDEHEVPPPVVLHQWLLGDWRVGNV